MSVAIETLKKGEEEKLSQALHQLKEEDPTLIVEVSQELKQTLIHCQGDMHLAVAKWKIEHLHKVDVKFVKPRIPYRRNHSPDGRSQLPPQKTEWGRRSVWGGVPANRALV